MTRYDAIVHRRWWGGYALDPVAIVEDDAAYEMSLRRVLETSQPPEVIGTHRGPRLDLDSGNLA